mmetsp:Transcript_75086/g.195661  ORF Transcript_75086/g.195661 Transcript_75086/m.195661 type:complete len:352 (+) Transcript_75086:1-1056(+)
MSLRCVASLPQSWDPLCVRPRQHRAFSQEEMPWAPPSWCAEPGPDAPQAVVTLQSQAGQPRRHDISEVGFFLLKKEKPDADGADESGSSWHAAVIRDQHGKFFIMDLSSTSGTYMNQQRLEPNKPYEWDARVVVVLGKPITHDKVALEIRPRQRGQKRPGPDVREQQEAQTKQRKEAVSAASGGGGSSSSGMAKKCDKCDGPHPTDSCPHFQKAREQHKDAWANYGQKNPLKMGKSGGRLVVRQARTVPQPGDGSCLFHSLCFGLNGGQSHGQFRAGSLRKELASFIQRNPLVKISGDTLEEWVKWDARTSVSNYARRMSSGGWGGGIEMAACSLLKKVLPRLVRRRVQPL